VRENNVAVLDTNILIGGIVEKRKQDECLLDEVLNQNLRLFVSAQIRQEYLYVLSRKNFELEKDVARSNRDVLNQVLVQARFVNEKRAAKELGEYSSGWIKDKQDAKFVRAADVAATLSRGICHLITNDHHLLSIKHVLVSYGIAVQHPQEFLAHEQKFISRRPLSSVRA